MRYGFNYTHFTAPTPARMTSQQGVVKTYNANRTLAQDQLGLAVKNGLKAIRIPLFMLAAEDLGGVNGLEDGFTLKLTKDSLLADQEMANLLTLLHDVKSAGFEYVEVGPGAAGQTLSPYEWAKQKIDLGTRWQRMANFIAKLRPVMLAMGYPEWSFDLCGEWIDPNVPLVVEYAATIWTWYTTAFWLGQRCTDATISFTAEPQNLRALASVFRGTNPGGVVNWPKQLQVHIYGIEQGSIYSSSYQELDTVMKTLGGIDDSDSLWTGAPADCLISVGETYDYRDITNAAEVDRAIQDNPDWNYLHVLQWPIMRPGVNSSPALEPYPTAF